MSTASFIADKDLGYVQIGAGGVDVAITARSAFPGSAMPFGTETLLITPEVGSIRWRSDGIAPTATVGFLVPVNSEYRYNLAQFPRLQFIGTAPGAIVNMYALGRTGNSS